MKKLKVGFVGSGFIARFHAAAMAQTRNLELSGVLDRKSAQDLVKLAHDLDLGPTTIYPSISEMAKHVDAIAIYCPNQIQVEVMEEIAAAKKAGAMVRGVFAEKPLGRNVAEARKLVQLCKDAGLLTAYFENMIHTKFVQAQMKQLAPQQKSMGPLMITRCAEEHCGPHMPWFWDPTRQGGGALLDMGCHSIAVGWYVLNPIGKPPTFLIPETVSCEIALLKWGQPYWRDKLLAKYGVDYYKTPAEDFATGIITYRNPETNQRVKAQFTDSWMYDKQGLRLLMDGLGPSYAFEVNTLLSPLTVFVGDEARDSIADGETALEKSTTTRGLMTVHYNEADLYGYVDENREAAHAFLQGRDGLLPLSYGLEITKLVMASYMSAERGKTIDLTDPKIQAELETFVPAVQKGEGAALLLHKNR